MKRELRTRKVVGCRRIGIDMDTPNARDIEHKTITVAARFETQAAFLGK